MLEVIEKCDLRIMKKEAQKDEERKEGCR